MDSRCMIVSDDRVVDIIDDIYIGIDPGINGAIACVTGDDMFTIPCPKTILDMANSVDQLVEIHEHTGYRIHAIIEAVHSMPKQGVVSTFKFGCNYGQWLGILASSRIPYTQVTPQVWMKHYKSMPKDKTARKNHLKHLAQQRYPKHKVTLKTADAILLAEYCRYNAVLSNYSPQ